MSLSDIKGSKDADVLYSISIVSDVEMARNEVCSLALPGYSSSMGMYNRNLTLNRFSMAPFQKAFHPVRSLLFTVEVGKTRLLASPTCKKTRTSLNGALKMLWMSKARLEEYLRTILVTQTWRRLGLRSDQRGYLTLETPSKSLFFLNAFPSAPIEITGPVEDATRKYT